MKAIRSSSVYKKVNVPRNVGNTTQYAVSTEDARPVLQHVHVQDGREYAADNFRLHIAPSASDHCETCQREEYQYPDVNVVIPKRHTFEFSTNAAWLRAAAVRAGIFSGVVDTGRIILDASLDNLTVTGWDKELGTSVNDVALLRTEGNPLRFGLNYKFLIDALDHCAPDGGVVVIKLSAPTAPVLIEGYANERVAVVMPAYVSNCNPHLLGTYEDNENTPVPRFEGYYIEEQS